MGKEKAKPSSGKKNSSNAKEGTSFPSTVNNGESNNIWQDARFQHLVSDPRFKNLPKTQRKVKIDKRFQGMFTDEKFKVKYEVDKYGRKVNRSNAEDLRKFYELDESSDEAEELEEQKKEEKAITKEDDTSNDNLEDENDDLACDGEVVPESLKERLLDPNIDYARGEGRLLTDSSSDEESSDEEDPELYIDHVWGELDADAGTTDQSTKRLAVCNMDWDRIRAQDLMVLFSSFLPPGGCILNVKIYPSQFGKERMAAEEEHGPIELKGLGKQDKTKELEGSSGSEDDLVKEEDSDAEEGDEYHMEKLRQYQLNRLKYFYAVVECDSVETADKIYKECDGIEYESSASKVDLRFIPDDTSFDDDEPTDECIELPDPNSYKPRQFTTTALQQAKVDLTWDETAVDRRELGDKLASGKLDEVDDKDLRKIVAYSSEEDDEDEDEAEAENDIEENLNFKVQENQSKISDKTKNPLKKQDIINKYKSLLAEITEKEEKEKSKKYEMEFSWNVSENEPNKDASEKAKNPDGGKSSNLTTIEKVLQKKAEKNKKRKEERKQKKKEALGIHSEESDDSDSIPDGIDMNDPYFAEEFANSDFIDPKKSKKKNKLKKKDWKQSENEETKKKEEELALLLDDEEDGKQHFSLEKIIKAEVDTKSKKKRRKQLKKSKISIAEDRKELEDNFQINLDDNRFNAIYSSPLFNIDPSDSHFKKTKAMEKLIHEKLKRRHGDGDGNGNDSQGHLHSELHDPESEPEPKVKRPTKEIENKLIIKNLKRKLQNKTY